MRIKLINLDSCKKRCSCGLLVNELLSNSLKYAFPRDRRGEITIL